MTTKYNVVSCGVSGPEKRHEVKMTIKYEL